MIWESTFSYLGQTEKYAVEQETRTGGSRWVRIEAWDMTGEYVTIYLFDTMLRTLTEKMAEESGATPTITIGDDNQ